jgi:NADP-dependent 3-hydroxy acid dehydrogenase YdfG
MNSLTNQIAIVTGASSGIGKAIAIALGNAGATVCVMGRRESELRKVASTISSARVYPSDLARDEDISQFAQSITNEFGRIDILVHSAAAYLRDRLDIACVEDMDVMYRANLRAPFLLTQKLIPLLKKPKGSVVFINSRSGMVATPNVGQYSVMKHGLKGLADAFRDELNDEGIRFTSIYLGRVATPTQKIAHERDGKPYRPERLLQPEDVAQVVLCAVSLPWTAELTDIHLRHMLKP